MNRESKAMLYDELIRKGDALMRENSRLNSMYPINVPEDVKKTMEQNKMRLVELEKQLNKLIS